MFPDLTSSNETLTNIFFSRNEIECVTVDLLNGMNSLVEIDLSRNMLNIFLGNSCSEMYHVENSVPAKMSSLKILRLSRNRLTHLPDLRGAAMLEQLYLDNNLVEHSPWIYFEGLSKLKILHLTSNKLISFPDLIFLGSENSLDTIYTNKNQIISMGTQCCRYCSLLGRLEMPNNYIGLLADLSAAKSTLRLLNINNNEITSLDDGLLLSGSGKWTALKKILANDNLITSVNKNLLEQFPVLEYIELNNNRIFEMPDFSALQNSLLELTMNQNLIKKVYSGYLKLPKVRTVDLSYNLIQMFAFAEIEGMTSLKWIKLEYNHMTAMPIVKIAGSNFPKIFLFENPFHCSDKMCWIRKLAIPDKVYLSTEPCSTPANLRNKTWEDITVDDLMCSRKYLYTAKFATHVKYMCNMCLACVCK